MKTVIGLVFALCFAAAYGNYEGYQVLQFHAKDRIQAELLYNLTDAHLLDLWNENIVIDGPTDIMFSPEQLPLASKVGIPFKVLVSDVQKFFDAAWAENEVLRANASYAWSYTAYQPLNEITDKVTALLNANADIASRISAGVSLRNVDIGGLKLSVNNGRVKRVVVFNGGQHAREWITPMTAIYMLEQLTLPVNRVLLEDVDFHVFPVMNPDGYLNSWTSSANRNHRKNMRANTGSTCIGVDNNRNWNSNWNQGGSSTNPCADNYMGPRAGSEPENTNIGNYLTNVASNPAQRFCYMDIHAYGNLFMTPYGYASRLPANYAAQKQLADGCAAAIARTHGLTFRTGNVFNTIYQASGASNDYAYDVSNFRYSFAIECRGSNFNPPPVPNILQSGQEMFAALQVVARQAQLEEQINPLN